MKFFPVLIIISLVILPVRAQEFQVMSDEEISAHKKNRGSQMWSGTYYLREFPELPGNKLRTKLPRVINLKQIFCEALTNTVVRSLTSKLRQNVKVDPECRTFSWQAEREFYSYNYEVTIKNDLIVYEECVLIFSGMPVLRTVNGKMALCPKVSNRQLRKVLRCLKNSNIQVKEAKIGINREQKKEAENLVDSLDLDDNSQIYTVRNNRQDTPQIKIILEINRK